MAVWLRMVIQILVVREPIEAFKYLENARELVATAPVSDDLLLRVEQGLISGWDMYRTTIRKKRPSGDCSSFIFVHTFD